MKIKIEHPSVIDCPNSYSVSSKPLFSWFIRCEDGFLMICSIYNSSNYVFIKKNEAIDIRSGYKMTTILIKNNPTIPTVEL
jgi:hypothetical protein